MVISLRDGETLHDYAYRVTAERDAALAEVRRLHGLASGRVIDALEGAERPQESQS